MATLSTATSNFSTLVQEVVAKAAEEELRSRLVHAMPGNYLPTNFIKGTNLVRLARYADIAITSTTVALTEGTAPTAQALTIASEGFSATQVGGVFELTDLAQLDSPHDLIAINAERSGRQAAATIDYLVKVVLQAGASQLFISGSAISTIATSNVMTGAFVKKVVANLARTNVPTFSDGFYRAIIHPDTVYDLFTDTASGGWMDASKYVDNTPLLNGELGRYHRVRFLETSAAAVTVNGGVTNADVYSTYFFGPDSYTLADSQNLSAYFVAPGGDHTDPIAQKAAIGWKVRFGCMLVDEAGPRYVNAITGATLGT